MSFVVLSLRLIYGMSQLMRDDVGGSMVGSILRVLSNYKKGLKVVHINAQSLLRKIDEFRFLFVKSNVDVICVSEMWFMSEKSDLLINCDGYNVFRSDRAGYAGGVAIYVSNCFNCEVKCKQPSDSPIEYIFLEVYSKANEIKSLIGCIYRPNRTIDYAPLIDATR